MDYISVPSKRQTSVGASQRERSIRVTNVDENNENTLAIEEFKNLDQAAREKATKNQVKDNDVNNVTDNPSNHLYHRFDRESKHPKKRKFVYFDPNEPKKLFGVKPKKVNKKENRSSVSPSQSPSARNQSSPPRVVTTSVTEMNITKSRNDSPHKATTTTTSSLFRSGKHFFSDAQEEEARLYYVEVKERH